jgi:hypothetical protein
LAVTVEDQVANKVVTVAKVNKVDTVVKVNKVDTVADRAKADTVVNKVVTVVKVNKVDTVVAKAKQFATQSLEFVLLTVESTLLLCNDWEYVEATAVDNNKTKMREDLSTQSLDSAPVVEASTNWLSTLQEYEKAVKLEPEFSVTTLSFKPSTPAVDSSQLVKKVAHFPQLPLSQRCLDGLLPVSLYSLS